MVKFCFLCFFVLFTACQKMNEPALEHSKESLKETFFEEIDTEVDKDQDGCLNTAGYRWSDLKKDCIKVHLIGLRLDPALNQNNEDAQNALYMIFSEDAQKVEIYLPQAQKPIVLSKLNDLNHWEQDDFSLVLREEMYYFKKNNLVSFKGLGQIGPRVTGSDRIED